MRVLGLFSLLLTIGLAGLVLACAPQDVPGEVVGTYHFVGPLEVNECGSGFPATDSLDMRVELRRDLTMGVWRSPQAAISYGVIEDDETPERWVFEAGGTYPAYEGCAFVQEETIELDTVDDDGASGTTVIRIYPSSGSNCAASLAALGGPFLTLPCEARWAIEGEPIDPIF